MKLLLIVYMVFFLACTSTSQKPANIEIFSKIELDGQPLSNTGVFQASSIFAGFKDAEEEISFSLAEHAETQLEKQANANGIGFIEIPTDLNDNLLSKLDLIDAGELLDFNMPDGVNIVLAGKLSSTTYTQTWYDQSLDTSLTGTPTHTIPAHCNHEATISGSIVFYTGRPLKHHKTQTFSGTAVANIEGHRCDVNVEPLNQELFLSAIKNGLEGANHKIINILARTGIVTAAYQDKKNPDKRFYRISVPPNAGAIPGVKVKFYETFKNTNNTQRNILIGEGRIACTNHPEDSYAVVSDARAISKIKHNTPVELNFNNDPIKVKILKKMYPCNHTD